MTNKYFHRVTRGFLGIYLACLVVMTGYADDGGGMADQTTNQQNHMQEVNANPTSNNLASQHMTDADLLPASLNVAVAMPSIPLLAQPPVLLETGSAVTPNSDYIAPSLKPFAYTASKRKSPRLISWPALLMAETHFITGVHGGVRHGNRQLGAMAGIEIQLGRIEVDAWDEYSPINSHISMGWGAENVTDIAGFVSLTRTLAIGGVFEKAGYTVPSLAKSGFYAYGGARWRTTILGLPGKVDTFYVRQIRNGITNGVETNHVAGGEIVMDVNMTCKEWGCVRWRYTFMVGESLQQGNPVCDGSWGPTTCPRFSSLSAVTTVGVIIEIGKNREE